MKEIFTRTSVRKWKEQPVEPEKIDAVLRAAFAAPSACNQQPWEFYVVTRRETIEALSQVSPYAGAAAGAPLVFVVAYREAVTAPELTAVDCAIATENMWLALEGLGLGGVMMAIAPDEERMEKTRAALGLPAGVVPFCLLPIGYPAEKHPQQDRYDAGKIHTIA